MKLREFTPDVAKRVMELWEEHLGLHRYGSQRYFEHPEELSSSVRNPSHWYGPWYEERIGSKFTEDSKFKAYFDLGQLMIECYAQAHTVFGEDKKQEAERAEHAFNKAVMEYITTVK